MTIFRSNPFHPAPNVSLYQAFYIHLRAAILSGELKGGIKLPSTRALADELNISRNTVLNAYRQLMAEGYLEGREFRLQENVRIQPFFSPLRTSKLFWVRDKSLP